MEEAAGNERVKVRDLGYRTGEYDPNAKPWGVEVDGVLLRTATGVARQFKTPAAAILAGEKAVAAGGAP